MKVTYVPWPKALRMCYELACKVLRSRSQFDVIVTISRGGLIPARIVSDVLGVEELYTIRSKLWGIGGRRFNEPLIKAYEELPVKGGRVLVIDEVVDTGSTMASVINLIKGLGAAEVKSGVLHYKLTSSIKPDYYVEAVRDWVWIFYPWSLSETLYGLASKRGDGVVNEALRIAEELGAGDGLIGLEDLKLSLMEYVRRCGG